MQSPSALSNLSESGTSRLLAVVGVSFALLLGVIPSPAVAASTPLYFGTLMTQPQHAGEEASKGVKVAMLELSWADYEPAEGQFNAAYAREMRTRFDTLRAAGMRVTLALGLHYSPKWVYSYPNSRFINQSGQSSGMVNIVFNQPLRQRVDKYFARIDQDLGLENFWATRLTSGGSAEMLFPDGGSYWAFDANAQNGADRPPSMAPNPNKGWKPGDRSISTASVAKWADWYIAALGNVTDWQMRSLATLGFRGFYQTLTPGSGARPNGYASDVANYLPNSITGVGAVWHKYYALLPNRTNVVAYVSSVADKSGGDDSCQLGDRSVAITDGEAVRWSATRWVSRVADEYNLIKNGENPGWNAPPSFNASYVDASPSGMMATTIRQATSCGFQGVYWAHSDKLWDGTVPFSRYADAIQGVNGGNNPVPALPGPVIVTPPVTVGDYTGVDDAAVGDGQERFAFSSGWSHCKACGNGRLFRGTTSWSSTEDSYVTIRFTGTRISLYGEADVHHGIGAASIDSGIESRIDYYLSKRVEDKRVWTSPILSNTTHTLRLRVTGDRNVASLGTDIPVDRVVIICALARP